MLTSIWGPPLWHTLHIMSFNYPVHPTEATKANYRGFILSLQHVLPCGKCRENIVRNLEEMPLSDADLANRDAFSRLVHALHDHINKMLSKPPGPSYTAVRDRYEAFRARCSKPAPGEKGCTRAARGRKAKCVMRIVPHDDTCATFKVDRRCKAPPKHRKTRRRS